MARTFQATIGGKFAPLIRLKDENMDINTMITTYNIAVTDGCGTWEGTSLKKSRGSPKLFSASVMRGEI